MSAAAQRGHYDAAEVRDQLAKALAAQHSCDTLLTIPLCNRCRQSADAVLPVVERLVAEAAMRGRAALAGEVEELANPQQWTQWLTTAESRWVADRLRALVDGVTQ